jgi:hypothetical protein
MFLRNVGIDQHGAKTQKLKKTKNTMIIGAKTLNLIYLCNLLQILFQLGAFRMAMRKERP